MTSNSKLKKRKIKELKKLKEIIEEIRLKDDNFSRAIEISFTLDYQLIFNNIPLINQNPIMILINNIFEKGYNRNRYSYIKNRTYQNFLIAKDILTRDYLSNFLFDLDCNFIIDIIEGINKVMLNENAKIIQRAFRKFRYDPQYKFCERVLINNLKDIGIKF